MNDLARGDRKIIRLQKGECLFRQNDQTNDLYILKNGKATIYKSEAGVNIELDKVEGGGVVGEIASIDGKRRSATVVADEDLDAIMVPFNDFQRIITRLPDWLQKIAKILVQRLRDVDDRIDFCTEGDKTAHVAELLSLMAPAAQPGKEEGRISFPASRVEDEICDMLRVPIAEATAALDKLHKQGLLIVERGRVTIPDLNKLESLGQKIYQRSELGPVT
jgi:CRP-like cAMP-binding protein